MVTRPLRQSVGAHYGSRSWLIQRATAVIMVVYTLLFLGLVITKRRFDYESWTTLFGSTAFRVASALFIASLCWHAWIGMRDIWMDYVKPAGVRLLVEALTVLMLITLVVWAVDILWLGAPA
jgi:succinate dehydrogenase / fumarate reductase membrane anchor subunit